MYNWGFELSDFKLLLMITDINTYLQTYPHAYLYMQLYWVIAIMSWSIAESLQIYYLHKNIRESNFNFKVWRIYCIFWFKQRVYNNNNNKNNNNNSGTSRFAYFAHFEIQQQEPKTGKTLCVFRICVCETA